MSNAEGRMDAAPLRPHAYDPDRHPEYFEGVLARRVIAFLVDLIILALPMMVLALAIMIVGILTLGLGLLLFWLMPAVGTIWAIVYYGTCFAHPSSATIGMRMMDLEMRTWYGERAYFVLGAVHAVLFWISVTALTPLVLLLALLNARRRLLHDMVLGTIVINSETRAQTLRASGTMPKGPPQPEVLPPLR